MTPQQPIPPAVRYFMGAGSTLIGLVAILAIFFHHSDKSRSQNSGAAAGTNAVSHPRSP